MAFAVSTDVETRLGRTLSAEELLQVDVFLDEATDLIQAQTGQQITQSSSTVVMSGGRRQVILPQFPVTAVTVTVDTLQYQSYHFSWTTSGVLTRLGTLWPAAFSVTYTHGYATVPGPLARLCARLAADLLNGKGNGVSREGIGSYSVAYADPSTLLTLDDRALLDSYRQVLAP